MNFNETLENLRVSYQASSLDIDDCHSDPVVQFDKWLGEAISSKCDEPNAFILSTASDNRPRSRVVLLKGIHENNFVFYTNYESAKANELASNDQVAMTFLWLPLQRQIRIEGSVKKLSSELSEQYFHKRPRGSQLGAIASPQSQRVESRDALEKLFHETEAKFQQTEVLPMPFNWGGYMINASFLEFWQGRNNRMHDRICYERKGLAWDRFRVAP